MVYSHPAPSATGGGTSGFLAGAESAAGDAVAGSAAAAAATPGRLGRLRAKLFAGRF